MILRLQRILCCFIVSICISNGLFADEWRQFRGANASGKSDDNVPIRWSEKQNLIWKVALPGPGSSSPILSQGKLFLTCYSGYGVDASEPGEMDDLVRHLLCLDQKTGRILWKKSIPARLPEDPFRGYISEHGYASSTPTTDGQNVFVFFGKTGVIAFDFSGNELWRSEVGQESSRRRWGSAASLILHNEKLIVNASDESQSIRALDKKTGRQIWKAEATSLELAYGTPQLFEQSDGSWDLLIAVPEEVWGLNVETGKIKWFAQTGLPGNICPSLTVAKGIAYGFGGYPKQGSFAVRLGGRGDVSTSHILWKSRISSYVTTPVFHQDHLYWITDRGKAMCMRAKDGELIFEKSLPNLKTGRRRAAYASLILAGNRFYATTRYGGTYVFSAKPSFELIARNEFASDTSQFNGTPAVSDDRLYLRSDRFAYSIGKH